MANIVQIATQIYKEGDFSYLLFKYIDRDFWTNRLKGYFQENHIENATDFNYSKCFSLIINLSNTDVDLGTKEFKAYLLKNDVLYRLEIQISVLAPFMMYKFLKYFRENDGTKLECNDNPYINDHSIYLDKVKNFSKDFELTALFENDLKLEVPGVSLELRGDSVSVYNCLFEDTASFYPY